MQLHVHGAAGKVTISRRGYAAEGIPLAAHAGCARLRAAAAAIDRCTINTMNNCAQETLMDGGGASGSNTAGTAAINSTPCI